jgi:hypothetical protein
MSGPGKPSVTIKGRIGAAQTLVHIATPAYGSSFTAEYVQSLFRLLSARPKRPVEYRFGYIDYADIVTARNYLISDFFFNHPDRTHLLFLDDDMGFEPGLIEEMIALNEPLVGTIYPKRRVDLKKLHAAKDLPFEKALARSVDFIGEVRKPMEGKGSFISVNHCGTGIMLISRACIEAMIAKLPELVDTKRVKGLPFAEKFPQFITPFDKIRTGDAEFSEDFSFCRRWVVDCGGRIWAHMNRSIRHAGSLIVDAKYSDR